MKLFAKTNNFDLLTSSDTLGKGHSKSNHFPWVMSNHSIKFHKDLITSF